jgi:hypothetical protein
MIIVIEGSDGVGKTTLAKSLQKSLKSAYVHYGPLPLWWRIWDYKDRLVRHAVYDRYHWSSYAYSSVYPQPIDVTPEDCVRIDSDIRRLLSGQYATVLVYCSEPNFFENRAKDDLFDVKQIKAVNERYALQRKHFDVAHDIAVGYANADRIIDRLREKLLPV